MTGGAYMPPTEYDDDLERASGHSVQWVGTPGVKGPSWARLPLLTVGMLGTQVVWSIEMGYASPFLLELGLSKSWMSLVFMAGPLSGLIVQPLIGAYADRSRSRFGRRRPFMLAGTAIAVLGIMLLGWSKEVAGLFGFGNWMAIALAVFSIYLIDFSINAVMATDRALIVDTLPSSQQEEGNAWAGRMMGIGGVGGFFVGTVDVTKVFLLNLFGKTQLQILSFITGVVLALAHTSTSWAVTERVLLRDDRPQSRSGLLSSLRAIWTNMFTLPPSIRMICFIQFFANLGWYPILFFTSIWISDIYKLNSPQGDRTTAEWEDAAVRSGSRALFMQSCISLVVSVGAPFLVCDSGIMPGGGQPAPYRPLPRGDDEEDDSDSSPNSAVFKRHAEEFRHASLPHRAAAAVASVIKAVKTGSAWALPIKGLTLIKLWFFAQIIFCLCMLCTLFTSTVNGAYGVIATSGFAWALAQWAPFALLGELVLIDSPEGNRTEMRALAQAPASEVVFATEASNSATSPLQSRNPSRSHMRHVSHETITDESDRSRMNASAERIPRRETNASVDLEIDTTVVLRHSDEFSVASQDDILTPSPPDSARDPRPSTADKAGLILGIHNVFIVLPQFVITLLSSVIFAVMDDSGSGKAASAVSARSPAADGPSSPNAVAIVFRIGGAAAAVGAYLSYRLARRWKMSGPS